MSSPETPERMPESSAPAKAPTKRAPKPRATAATATTADAAAPPTAEPAAPPTAEPAATPAPATAEPPTAEPAPATAETADPPTAEPAPATAEPSPARTGPPKVVIVMPAYNAALTLERTYADIPHDIVDRIILVDDVSRDQTVDVARQLGLDVIIHQQNKGYGGNQKTCYDAALEAGADIVVMLHPDYQYDATRIPALIAPIVGGERDLMLGSRFLGDPLAGGMPRWKYISNRFLTIVENQAFGLHLSEYHTGLRAYSRSLLETIPYRLNSDDFVFDQELIAQVVAARMGGRIGEIGVPTRYFEEASSVGFQRSVVYGLSTMRVVLRYMLHRLRIRRSPKLKARRPAR